MKKKLVSILLVTAMAAVSMAGCGGQSKSEEGTAEATEAPAEETEAAEEEAAEETEAAEEETAETTSLEDRTKFIVGFDAEYPPYGYMDENGEYVGFDLECAQLVCDALGWELEKKPINWDSKDMELNSGTIDCIWNGFSITPDRLDKYTWSDPYVDNSQVIVVPADSDIQSLADLAGKNVVVQAASSALEALNGDDCKDLTASFASLTENPDYNTAFMNLESGAADACAIDIGVAKYQIAQRGEDNYRMLEEPFYSEQYAIGFRLGDEELRDAVQAEMNKLAEEGKVAELAAKYEIDENMLCIGQ